MKSFKRNLDNKPQFGENNASYFSITSILLNIIVILILVGIYYYIFSNNYYPEYQNYIYWPINILISYNILVASARSLWAPLLSIAAGMIGIFYANDFIQTTNYITDAQCWQFAILGIIGLVINFALRL